MSAEKMKQFTVDAIYLRLIIFHCWLFDKQSVRIVQIVLSQLDYYHRIELCPIVESIVVHKSLYGIVGNYLNLITALFIE